jgi:hypothetical protein
MKIHRRFGVSSARQGRSVSGLTVTYRVRTLRAHGDVTFSEGAISEPSVEVRQANVKGSADPGRVARRGDRWA